MIPNKSAKAILTAMVLILLIVRPAWAQDDDSANAQPVPPHIAGAWTGFLTPNTPNGSVTAIDLTFVQNSKTIEGIWQQSLNTEDVCFPTVPLLMLGTFKGIISPPVAQAPATFKATFVKTAINSEANADDINRCSMKLEGTVTVTVNPGPVVTGTYTSCKGETGTFVIGQQATLGAVTICP